MRIPILLFIPTVAETSIGLAITLHGTSSILVDRWEINFFNAFYGTIPRSLRASLRIFCSVGEKEKQKFLGGKKENQK